MVYFHFQQDTVKGERGIGTETEENGIEGGKERGERPPHGLMHLIDISMYVEGVGIMFRV
jgi:hypothetical protein